MFTADARMVLRLLTARMATGLGAFGLYAEDILPTSCLWFCGRLKKQRTTLKKGGFDRLRKW